MNEKTKDSIGDRMKTYERVQTAICLDKSFPIVCRLDGRGFSKFTKDMQRPFDRQMSEAMIETTKYLMQQTHCVAAYTQSDEISLVWAPAKEKNSGFFFEGKVQKLTSVLAAMATAKFMSVLIDDLRDKLPHFDCRIFNVPDQSEAANVIVWREIDARKNSVSMLARCHFSHQQLQGKNSKQMLEMLHDKGVSLQDYPKAFVSGTFLRTERQILNLSDQDKLDMKMPEHMLDKVFSVERSIIRSVDISPFTKVINKVDVIFEQAQPEFKIDNRD